ncbi:MAG: AtpZ/AtpI family protein [Maricaulaceae bacterium]
MTPPDDPDADAAVDAIARETERKQKARRTGSHGVWFGLGMFGLVGWSVAAPAVLGAIVGLWLDRVFPSSFSWALALLMAGVTIGCWNAWRWVSRESRGD